MSQRRPGGRPQDEPDDDEWVPSDDEVRRTTNPSRTRPGQRPAVEPGLPSGRVVRLPTGDDAEPSPPPPPRRRVLRLIPQPVYRSPPRESSDDEHYDAYVASFQPPAAPVAPVPAAPAAAQPVVAPGLGGVPSRRQRAPSFSDDPEFDFVNADRVAAENRQAHAAEEHARRIAGSGRVRVYAGIPLSDTGMPAGPDRHPPSERQLVATYRAVDTPALQRLAADWNNVDQVLPHAQLPPVQAPSQSPAPANPNARYVYGGAAAQHRPIYPGEPGYVFDDDEVLAAGAPAIRLASDEWTGDQHNPGGVAFRSQSTGRQIAARAWVFTSWEIAPPVPAGWIRPASVDFIVFQQELATNPAVGRTGLHWQGYVEFPDRRTSEQVRSVMGWDGLGIWLAPRRGTQARAIVYCKKENTRALGAQPVEYGSPRAPDAAEAWDGVFAVLQAGGSFAALLDSHPRHAIQYANGLNKAISALAKAPTWRDVKCYYLWGPPGSGKTSYVFQQFGHDNVYKKLDGQWWDGYTDESVLLFDDFNSRDVPLSYMLQLLDGHPLRVNQRGTTAVARWTKVFITANVPFDEFYKHEPATKRAALIRRLPASNIIHVDGSVSPRTDTVQAQLG